MNKLIVTLLAIAGLAILNVEAGSGYRSCRYGRSYCSRSSCDTACAPACAPVCETVRCAQPCKVDNVIEEPCPALPCCERYVAVREPAKVTKHISYSVECPDGCTEAQKQVGMMQAGEVWTQQPVEQK